MVDIEGSEIERVYQTLSELGAQHPNAWFPSVFVADTINHSDPEKYISEGNIQDCLDQLISEGRASREIVVSKERLEQTRPFAKKIYRPI